MDEKEFWSTMRRSFIDIDNRLQKAGVSDTIDLRTPLRRMIVAIEQRWGLGSSK